MNANMLSKLCWIALLLTVVGLSGCGNPSQNPPEEDLTGYPQGWVGNANFIAAYDLYEIGAPLDTVELKRSFQAAFPGLSMLGPQDSVGDGLLFRYLPDQSGGEPLDSTFLDYAASRLSPEERAGLEHSRGMAILGVRGGYEDRWKLNRRLCEFLGEWTRKSQVIVFDEATMEYDSRDSWERHRMKDWGEGRPTMARHIVLHAYREDDGLCRIVTLGMEKFCLPNISVRGASCFSQETMASTLNVIAQCLAEDDTLHSPGKLELNLVTMADTAFARAMIATCFENAVKRTEVTLRWSEPQEGDSPGPQLEIYSNSPAYSTQQAYQEAMVGQLFGFHDPLVVGHHEDAELQAASIRAKAELPRVKAMFNKGLKPGEVLMVKLPFEGGEAREWMWVEVTSWKGEEIIGTLNSDPQYSDELSSGDEVRGLEEDVFDYILNGPDGIIEGNGTGKVLEGKM